LRVITPPWFRFEVVGKNTHTIQVGTLIDYQLRLMGVRVDWRTEIIALEKNKKLVDIQIQGPYAKWQHTHCFELTEKGTLMTDEVVYKIPGNNWGRFLLGNAIGKNLDKIFSYREEKIKELFP